MPRFCVRRQCKSVPNELYNHYVRTTPTFNRIIYNITVKEEKWVGQSEEEIDREKDSEGKSSGIFDMRNELIWNPILRKCF